MEINYQNTSDEALFNPMDNGDVHFDLLEEVPTQKSSTTQAPKSILKATPQAKLRRIDEVLQEQISNANEQLYGNANDVISYMRSKWKLKLSRIKSSEEMGYRTVEKHVHERPEAYWIQNRGRQKFAEFSGILSDITKPFLPLGSPELDVPLFVLRNLPDSIAIDSSEWIMMQLRKEEERQRKEELLPRLPHKPSIKPMCTRSVINTTAGGSNIIGQLVKEGETFQRDIRGSVTFANLLDRWVENRENEKAKRGSAFGMVKLTNKNLRHSSSDANIYEKYQHGFDPKQPRRVAALDEKTYLAEMKLLEKMLLAILDLIKSMLNVTKEQLNSDYRIAEAGLYHLRSTSPEVNRKKKRTSLPAIALDRLKSDRSMFTFMKHFDTKRKASKTNDKSKIEQVLEASKAKIREAEESKSTIPKFRYSINREVPDILPIKKEQLAEVFPKVVSNSQKLSGIFSEINKVIESSTYLTEQVPEVFSKKMEETPLETSKRLEKNKHRLIKFQLIFEKVSKSLTPIWHEENFEEISSKTKQPKSKHRISSLTTLETSKLRHKDEHQLPQTPKIPHEDSIPTPTLPGSEEPIKLDSLETSRLNLITKMPDALFQIDQSKEYERLLRVSGVQSTDYSNFRFIMDMKQPFHEAERHLRAKVAREAEKFEQATKSRFYSKVSLVSDDPVFQKSIEKIRQAATHIERHEQNKQYYADEKYGKVPENWFRELIEKCESLHAFTHHGCATVIAKIYKYCDLRVNSRPKLLNRFALVVVSLPLNELGTARYQHAIKFLLDHLFHTPIQVMRHWLGYRGIPYLF